MSLRDTFFAFILAMVFTPLLLVLISVVDAQVMQSTSYRIESDSVNFGGGLSSSTNYTLESTAGEIATGELGSASFNMKAGYQQMTSTYLAMSAPTSVVMTPSIAGITGGTANGSTTVTVTTDSASGYQLTIASTQTPALIGGGNSIDEYVPSGNPDFTFITNPPDALFGYSPSGADTPQRFKDDGASCGVGSGETTLACWDGLSTTEEIISYRTSANTPLGSTTTVYFRVGIGALANQAEGVYTATTTLTAVAL